MEPPFIKPDQFHLREIDLAEKMKFLWFRHWLQCNFFFFFFLPQVVIYLFLSSSEITAGNCLKSYTEWKMFIVAVCTVALLNHFAPRHFQEQHPPSNTTHFFFLSFFFFKVQGSIPHSLHKCKPH